MHDCHDRGKHGDSVRGNASENVHARYALPLTILLCGGHNIDTVMAAAKVSANP